jgi:hypothetical protein
MQASASGSLVDRMMGAARLDEATYEAVERDTNATTQAAIVVVIAAVASGIGALGDGGEGLIWGIVAGILGWIAFAAVAYIVGTKILAAPGTEADLGQLLRVLGFAQVPNILTIVGFVPILGIVVALIVFVWRILTTIVALRAALEMSTGRAIATAIISVIIESIIVGIILAIFNVDMYGT